jgi:hypothetical protein
MTTGQYGEKCQFGRVEEMGSGLPSGARIERTTKGRSKTMTDDEAELLTMDVELRRKQVAWETPRNIALLAGALAAIIGTAAGFIGYKIGMTPPAPIVIQMTAPK